MCKSLWIKLFSVLALTGAFVGASVACGPYPFRPRPISLPEKALRGVAKESKVAVISETGRLLVVNLASQKVRDLGSPGGKLLPFVDVSSGLALVATEDKAHVVNLSTGKTECSVAFTAKSVKGLGFTSAGPAFIHTDRGIVLLDLFGGKALHTVELDVSGGDRLVAMLVGWHYQVVGQRLYAAGDKIYVIDLAGGKLVKTARTPGRWVGGLHVRGDRAFVTGLVFGCGWGPAQLAQVDLNTGAATRLALPSGAGLNPKLVGVGGNLLVLEDNRGFLLDGSGKSLGEVTGARGTFLGAARGRAVFLRDGAVHQVPLLGL